MVVACWLSGCLWRGGRTLRAAAEAAGVSVRCGRKWVGRYREGDRRLRDRSSAPRRVANRTPADRVAVIVLLRRLRVTAAEIAETLQMPLSTVSLILKRQGLARLGRIGLAQQQRSERSRPGELVHVDVKKLGRLQPPRLRRGPRRRESDNSRRLPPPRDRLQSARRPPPANPPPPPTDQRQSRTLHPHPPIRLGIRTHLRLKPRTHRSTRRPALALQPSTTTLNPQPPTTGQQNQPPWVLQLAALGPAARRRIGEGVEEAPRVDVEREAHGRRGVRAQPEHPVGPAGETARGRVPVRRPADGDAV